MHGGASKQYPCHLRFISCPMKIKRPVISALKRHNYTCDLRISFTIEVAFLQELVVVRTVEGTVRRLHKWLLQGGRMVVAF